MSKSKIDQVKDDTTNIRVSIASIDGRLKTLNGNVVRHEKAIGDIKENDIKSLWRATNNNSVSVARLTAIIGGCSVIASSVVAFIVSKIIG